MKIAAINVFQVDLPLREGSYRWSGGKSVTVFDSTVVELVTDAGVSGWGEACPLGPVYLPSYAAGCRTGIAEVAPALLGADPRQVAVINRLMDQALAGHPYVKSALDMACWDLLGKAGGQPVCTLLGGRFGDAIALYRAISQGTAEEMAASVARYRAEGYRRFQLKVGGAAHEDVARVRAVAATLQPGDVLVADANTGWLSHQALQVAYGVRDLPVYIEQPCASYDECLIVRRGTALPFILDETMQDLRTLQRAAADGAMDAINVKISKFGGLTGARLIRDVCVALGIPMIIEGQLGRRHHHRRHRPPGAQHAARDALCGHRLQQLRDREHGGRCAAPRTRHHGRPDRARPGCRTAPGRARHTRIGGKLMNGVVPGMREAVS